MSFAPVRTLVELILFNVRLDDDLIVMNWLLVGAAVCFVLAFVAAIAIKRWLTRESVNSMAESSRLAVQSEDITKGHVKQ